MCNADCSLRLIAIACLLIIITDSFVLHQIFDRAEDVRDLTTPKFYD